MKELEIGIKAGFSFFYLQTSEPNRAISEITSSLQKLKEIEVVTEINIWDFEENPDPTLVITELDSLPLKSICLAKNFNWFLQDVGEPAKEIVQPILNRIESYSNEDSRKTLIIVSSEPIEKALPQCLIQHFRYLEYSLPTKEEISDIWKWFKEINKENPNWMPPKDESRIIDYAKGLTRMAVVNAFSLATIKGQGKIEPLDIAYLRAEEIEKTPGIKIGKFGKDFSSLKGYELLKKFVLSTIKSVLAKGVMLLGPPGTGKTLFAECLSQETGLLCIVGEMAELMGEGLVGQAEAAMKKFIEVVKANAPCILFIDEIEKGLSGVKSGSSNDGGTTTRSMGQLLKFLSNEAERKGVYVIATCNDISSLPPEWTRAERWDGVFFIDLPNEKEQKAILSYYQKEVYEVKGKAPNMNMNGWAGAEIKTCCRLAKMMNTTIEESSKFIIPIAKTKKKEIEKLRIWAKDGNCLVASEVIEKNEKIGRRKIDY